MSEKFILELEEYNKPGETMYARALLESALDFNEQKDSKLYTVIGKIIYTVLCTCPPIKTEKVTLKGSLYVAINTAFKTNNIPERLLRFIMIWTADALNQEEKHVNFPVFKQYEETLQMVLDKYKTVFGENT